MKITESQLRRIIRQEVRQLTEMPARGGTRPKDLDRHFKKPSPYNSAQSVDDDEIKAFEEQMSTIAGMLGAPDWRGLREAENDAVVSAVVLSKGRPVQVDEGGWAMARTGTLRGEPVVVVEYEDDGYSLVYKYVGGRPRQRAQGPAPSARTLRARLKALLGPASDRYELDAVYDFVWDIIQELRDPDPAGPQEASEILRMFEVELVRLLESNEQSGRTPGEIRETAKNIVAEFGTV